MLVGKLTPAQYEELKGPPVRMVQPDWYFNPFKNYNVEFDWVISTEEIDASIYPENDWVKNIPLIEYIPPTPISGDTTNVFDPYFKK